MGLYNPPAFEDTDLARQHRLIRACPFGLLISAIADVPQATALPFHLEAGQGPLGTLQGHVARANAHWRALEGKEALVVFQGPDAYISPAWYAAKAEHGKVVPTWNYATVHARGVARVIDDVAWLRAQATRLTEDHETPRDDPWQVTDAPAAYVDSHIRGIVGVEIEIRQLEGKWKMSQNRSLADRAGVIEGLAASGQQAVADLVRDRLPKK